MTFLHEGKWNNQELCHSNYFEPPLPIKPQQFPVNRRGAHNQSIFGFLVVFSNVNGGFGTQMVMKTVDRSPAR